MSSPWISNLEASLRSDFYSLQTAKCLMALVTETRMCCITSCNATCCNYTCPSFILVLKMQSGKIQSMKHIIQTCVLCDFTYLIDLDFSSMDCKSYSCAGSLIASTAMHTIISDFWRFKSQEYSTVSGKLAVCFQGLTRIFLSISWDIYVMGSCFNLKVSDLN